MMKMSLYKYKYEQYSRSKKKVIICFCSCDGSGQESLPFGRYYTVKEDDPQLNKTDKIYKTCLAFNCVLAKFKHYYVLGYVLSLDGRIPTKNKLSFRQYIKYKPINWGIIIVFDSDNSYICNAEIYIGKMLIYQKYQIQGSQGTCLFT